MQYCSSITVHNSYLFIPCALITTDERTILCTYDCTCILSSVATFIECIYEKNSCYDYVIFML
jgi:hypothetical protein